MALQTYACPACGSRKSLADAHPGEKIHCTCGMSFPASPVFAVVGAATNAGGSGRAVGVAIVLVVACGGVALWLLNRSPGPSPDHGSGEVAIAPQPVNVRPTVPDEGPAPVPVPDKPMADTVPPADVPAPDKPPEPTPPPPAPPPTLGPPVASIFAVTLWDAYDADVAPAVAAQYSDKVVEVKARGKVARDSIDRPYFGVVVVKGRGRTTRRMTPDEQRWEKEGYPPNVRCYLSAEQAAILEKAPADKEVVLRGVCAGRKDRDDVYRGYIVELANCVVVAPK